MKPSLLLPLALTIVAMHNQAPAPTQSREPLASQVFEWSALTTTATKTGVRRDVFDAPTDTVDRLHGHITTLNPGANTGPLHRHPQGGAGHHQGRNRRGEHRRPQNSGRAGLGDLFQRQREREHDQHRLDACRVHGHPVVHAQDAEELATLTLAAERRPLPDAADGGERKTHLPADARSSLFARDDGPRGRRNRRERARRRAAGSARRSRARAARGHRNLDRVPAALPWRRRCASGRQGPRAATPYAGLPAPVPAPHAHCRSVRIQVHRLLCR